MRWIGDLCSFPHMLLPSHVGIFTQSGWTVDDALSRPEKDHDRGSQPRPGPRSAFRAIRAAAGGSTLHRGGQRLDGTEKDTFSDPHRGFRSTDSDERRGAGGAACWSRKKPGRLRVCPRPCFVPLQNDLGRAKARNSRVTFVPFPRTSHPSCNKRPTQKLYV